jgi:hypothetical protein
MYSVINEQPPLMLISLFASLCVVLVRGHNSAASLTQNTSEKERKGKM